MVYVWAILLFVGNVLAWISTAVHVARQLADSRLHSAVCLAAA